MGKKEFTLLKTTRDKVIKLECEIADMQGELKDLTEKRSTLNKEVKNKRQWLEGASTEKLEKELNEAENQRENKRNKIQDEIAELLQEKNKYENRQSIKHKFYLISITIFVALVGVLSQIDDMRYYTCENGDVVDTLSLSDDPSDWGCWDSEPFMESMFFPSTSGFYVGWSLGIGFWVFVGFWANASLKSEEIEQAIEEKEKSKNDLKPPTHLKKRILEMKKKKHNHSIQIPNDEKKLGQMEKQIESKTHRIQQKSAELLELWSKVKHMLPE